MLKFTLLLLVGALWGSQYIFIKIALVDLSPPALTFFRIAIGTLFIAILCAVLPKERTPRSSSDPPSAWWWFAIIGLLEAAIPALLIAWGEVRMESSLAAILLGTTPLFTIVLSCFLLRLERIRTGIIVAVVLGFAGLVFLFAFRMQFDQSIHVLSSLAVLLAALSFALSLVLLAQVKGHSPQNVARNLMFWAMIALLPVWLIWGSPSETRFEWASIGAVVYLGTLGSSIVFLLYVQLIRIAGATFASLSNYLVPIVGVILGVTLGRDHILITDLIALAIILSALFAAHPSTLGRFARKKRIQ